MIDQASQPECLRQLESAAQQRHLVLCVGLLRQADGAWVNEAVALTDAGPLVYRKVNLSEGERTARFSSGQELPVFETPLGRIGIQLCRELRFSEQWLALAAAGAEVIVHLNAGTSEPSVSDVWRSMLVARGHETQRFVASANIANKHQHAPSVIVHPSGRVLCDVRPAEFQVGHTKLNLADNSDRYLSQRHQG